MKQLGSAQIRQMFLDFFKEKGHQIEPSASLVPQEDPTLLWINSGVATMKKYFDGRVIPNNPRLVNAQKSIRTNDIENVGFTARHHTFFEMLGNFSIGDYFKKQAIEYAWEFLTSERWLGFNPERLAVTVHPEDDEAYDIWLKDIQIPETQIIRLEENFWDIGEGPSGPNSEIFYDRGKEYDHEPSPELYPGGENERYLEIWNLVFSQYNHNPDGTYTPLPKKNIDTGMGLERLVSVVQDTPTNFETDLFMPIIRETEAISGKKYGQNDEDDTAFKVIADHIRTVTFAITDKALPSNEGRGYVLRRLLRRAVRFAKQLSINEPFMYKLVSTVGYVMQDFYPDIQNESHFVENVIKVEEERFHETLQEGLNILNNIIEKEQKRGNDVFPGSEVFRLYDTYGFPKELTEEYVAEYNFTIDEQGFEEEMEKQRERARNARKNNSSMQVQDNLLSDVSIESEFVGYEQLETAATLDVIIKEDDFVHTISSGDEGFVFLNETPFYAESGGQIADKGWIYTNQGSAYVKDVQKSPKGQHVHHIQMKEGSFNTGDEVKAAVDRSFRTDIIKNHSATHLLHQVLKDVLGTHVNQAGSLVTPERLRFDFSHYSSITDDELEQIEQKVNEKIWASLPVYVNYKTMDEAKKIGAIALFGEKYEDIVRVVEIGDYSIELCGGCHVERTDSIGIFKIVSEEGVGAGTRRIEAVTSKQAYQLIHDKLTQLQQTANLLKTVEDDVAERVEDLFNEIKSLQKTNESLNAKLANQEASSILEKQETIQDIALLAEEVNADDMNQLRDMVDDLKQKMESGVIILALKQEQKVQLAAGVTKDLTEQGLHAGNLIKQAAEACGGGGGGRPDMAQAGGKKPEKTSDALQAAKDYVKKQLGE